MTLICYLFSGHGIFGTQLLVGKVSDFWVGVGQTEEEIKIKSQRSFSKLALLRKASSSANSLLGSLRSSSSTSQEDVLQNSKKEP